MKKTSPSNAKVQTKLSFKKPSAVVDEKQDLTATKGSIVKNNIIVLEDDDEFNDIDFSDILTSDNSSSSDNNKNNNNTNTNNNSNSSSQQQNNINTFIIPKLNSTTKSALKLSSQPSSSSRTSPPNNNSKQQQKQGNNTNNTTTIELFNIETDQDLTNSMHRCLKKYFRLDEFRPNQFEIIFNLIKNKQDTLVILPTGGGKSLCYQLPSLLLPGGVTLVVSPLISLMHNQVQALEHLCIPSNYWNSSQKKSEISKIQSDLESGHPTIKLLYVTPELLTGSNQTFQSLMRLLASRDQLSLIAIDESHCISSWGHDFRKSFRQLSILKDSFPQVPIIALTATATEKVRSDIVESLKLRQPKCFISSFNRPNIEYEIRYKDLLNNPYEDLKRFLLEHSGECGIIYCRTRNQVDELVLQLSMESTTKTNTQGAKSGAGGGFSSASSSAGASKSSTSGVSAASAGKSNDNAKSDDYLFSCKSYHAGLKLSERKSVQSDWLSGKTKIIVGTIAYGMGIDKKDVRFVVHYGMPKSLEGFYQESGRAGRDGKKSKSLLYYCSREKSSIQFLISREEKLSQDRIQANEVAFAKVCEMCEGANCRRKYVLEFFGESYDTAKPHGITTITSPTKIKKTTTTNNSTTSKATLKLKSSSSKTQTSSAAPSTPTKKSNNQSSSDGSGSGGSQGGLIEILPQIKGVEYVETCCDYCANPKKKAEEIKNLFTYGSSTGSSSGGGSRGLGSKMADDFILEASYYGDDAIEEYNDDGDLDEFDGMDMEEVRRSEERDQNSFINRYRKQMGITNNSMITKSNGHTLTKTKHASNTTPQQQLELKRKRMEDNIDNVLDALEQEEKKQKRYSSSGGNTTRKSSLLPSKSSFSSGGSFDSGSSGSSSGGGGFVKASTLLSTSSSYRSSDMNGRSKTTTTNRPRSNLERFMSKK